MIESDAEGSHHNVTVVTDKIHETPRSTRKHRSRPEGKQKLLDIMKMKRKGQKIDTTRIAASDESADEEDSPTSTMREIFDLSLKNDSDDDFIGMVIKTIV